MILIADSGATKTDWACVSPGKQNPILFTTQGYNPNYITGEQIIEDITNNVPDTLSIEDIREIYFYGAGVTVLQYPFMRKVLKSVFYNAGSIAIAMDTLAACRALLGRSYGFAAILGTGANSCIYDGEKEVMNVDSGGFLLGDEGSGAYMGKRLIIDFIRKNMPLKAYAVVKEHLGDNNEEIIDCLYNNRFPNRFCAKLAPFIANNLNTDDYFNDLVLNAFRAFFDNIVKKYPEYALYPFNAVGSIAYYFKGPLERVILENDMIIGKIVKSPLEGLINYHLNEQL